MSTHHARRLLAAAAALAVPAALAAAPGAAAALTAATWTVHPGGSISVTSANLLFRDVKTRSTIQCSSTVLSGSLQSGSGLPGARIGSLTAATFTNCTNPLDARVTFILTAADLPWRVNVTGYNATNGIVTGNISHIHINVGGPGCTTKIDGTGAAAGDGKVRFAYANSTAKLRPHTIRRDLHFYGVMGCAGLFITGDPIAVTGVFVVSPGQSITSP